MKARVKATGEIVTITGTDGICLTDENGNYHLIRDLEGCEAMPDYWEKLKHQYAGMILAATYSSTLFENTSKVDLYKNAILMARELVNKLKEEEK